MDKTLKKIDFNQIDQLNLKLKNILETRFKLVYFEVRKEISDNPIEKNSENSFLHLFEIPKKEDSIFSSINSIDDLTLVKDKILDNFNSFLDEFDSYFERIEDKLDEKNCESFEIIFKTLKNRKKKLESALKKFKIEDGWNLSKIREELSYSLKKNLKDIIDSLIRPISIGLQDSSAYEEILKQFNLFLSDLGIYTHQFNSGDKLNDDDWNYVEPQEDDSCDTSEDNLKDVIKEVISYPYLIGDNTVISEGKIILWRYIKNG